MLSVANVTLFVKRSISYTVMLSVVQVELFCHVGVAQVELFCHVGVAQVELFCHVGVVQVELFCHVERSAG